MGEESVEKIITEQILKLSDGRYASCCTYHTLARGLTASKLSLFAIVAHE